jgi:mRNA interferase MazF
MSFSRGEVVLLPIPFTDLTSRKVRPAIVVGQSTGVGDLFVVPISSQLRNVEMALADWREAGLNVACGAKHGHLWRNGKQHLI